MKKYIYESLGSFGIGFILLLTLLFQTSSTIVVAVVLFLAIFLATYIFAGKTECFFNPAVALGFAITKRIKPKQFWAYLLSELIGFAVASLVILLISIFTTNFQSAVPTVLNTYGPDSGIGATELLVFVTETILTSLLVFVYLFVFDSKLDKPKKALIVAAAAALVFMITFPITGGSTNIAKTITTTLFFGLNYSGIYSFIDAIVFTFFGFVGSVLGWFFFRLYDKTKK